MREIQQLLQSNKYEEALIKLNTLKPSREELGPYYYLQAVTNSALNKNDEAIKFIDKAIEIDNSIPEMYHIKGNLNLKFGNLEGVVDCFQKVLLLEERKDEPDFEIIFNTTAKLYENKYFLADYDGAIFYAEKMLQLQNEFPEYINLGEDFEDKLRILKSFSIKNKKFVPEKSSTNVSSPYLPNSNFEEFFEEVVGSKISKNKSDNKIFGYSNDEIRANILEYGSTNFDLPYKNISVHDKTLLYCYFNMRKHIFTFYHILNTLKKSKYGNYFSSKLFQSDKVCINDIGCGPITGAIAYSLFCQKTENAIPEISYVGIDKSKAMLQQAKLFLQANISFFNPQSEFQFSTDWEHIPRKGFNFHEFYMGEKSTQTFFPQLHIFSYLFANLNEKETISLAKNIDEYFTGWSDREIVVVFQNSTDVSKNKMYEIFKENSKALRLVYNGNDTIKYHNNRQNSDKFIPSEEKVCYEILVNRTAYENMLNQENVPIKYKSKSTNDNDDLPF
jgi:tetratricopeptide (TPR) repeat protein